MSTVRLYDPNNEPFDVPQHMVDELVLGRGWTQTPQTDEEPAVRTVPMADPIDLDQDESFEDDEEVEAEDEEPPPARPARGRAKSE